jgi:hypothetical protein
MPSVVASERTQIINSNSGLCCSLVPRVQRRYLEPMESTMMSRRYSNLKYYDRVATHLPTTSGMVDKLSGMDGVPSSYLHDYMP